MQKDTKLLKTQRNDRLKLLQAELLQVLLQAALQCWWLDQIFVLARRLAVGILVNFVLVCIVEFPKCASWSHIIINLLLLLLLSGRLLRVNLTERPNKVGLKCPVHPSVRPSIHPQRCMTVCSMTRSAVYKRGMEGLTRAILFTVWGE